MVGQHPGLAPPVPTSTSVSVADPFAATQAVVPEVPEWHVSVNDVPIGPIRLEEMAHKIDAGAVSEYSLVWRDSFDEWRPLATVPELMSLLHERRHSGPPSRSSFSSMPPFVETRTSMDDLPAAAAFGASPLPTPPSSFPSTMESASGDEIAPLADALQPELPSDAGLSELSQPPAPLGPDGVFQSSPTIGSYSGLPPQPDDEVSVPPVPPEPAAATAEPESRLSLGILALIVAVAVFSGVVAFLAFERYGEQLMEQLVGVSEAPKAVTPTPAPAPEPEPVALPEPAPSTEADVVEVAEGVDGEALAEDVEAADAALTDDEADTEDVAEELAEGEEAKAATLVPPPDPNDNAPKMAPAPRPKPKAKARRKPRPKPVAAPVATESESDVNAADQKLLDEFGSSADTAPAKIAVKESGSTQSKKPALDGDAVRSTVTANKPKLQRCYERAIRGQQSPTAVRLDVSVMVASSGRVKNVSSEGSGPGGLAECIEASVRRWRFPASAEGGPARFPIVFSAN